MLAQLTQMEPFDDTGRIAEGEEKITEHQIDLARRLNANNEVIFENTLRIRNALENALKAIEEMKIKIADLEKNIRN